MCYHYECFIVNNRNKRSKIVQLLKQGRIFCCEYMDVCVAVKSGLRYARDPVGGGGGHSGIDGGRTHEVTYFAEEVVFFKTSACPRFYKKRVLFCTQVRSMGGENPLFNNPQIIRGSDDE